MAYYRLSFTTLVAAVSICVLSLALDAVRGDVDPRSYPFDSPDTFGTVRGATDDKSDDTKVTKPARSYSSPAGQSVRVFDDVAKKDLLQKLLTLSFGNEWTFQHRDGAAGGELEVDASGGNTPWSMPLDAVWFASTQIGKLISELVRGNWNRPQLVPYDVRFLALRRGDDTIVQSGIDAAREEVWSTLHVTQQKWKGDLYGETLFYDEADEVLAACLPRLGRLVAWDASLSHLFRPPSMSHASAQYILVIRWTENKALLSEMEEQRVKYDADTKDGMAHGLFTEGDRSIPADLDVSKYQVQHVVTRTKWKKNVYAFDNLLNMSDVDALRHYAKRYGNFLFNDYSVGDEGSDNVQWIGKYDIERFVQSKYWKIIQKVVEYVSGGTSTWYPYDVACNVIRSSDHTRIHGDVRNNEDTEWTLLIYLSPEWNESSYGETAWFTGAEDHMTNDVDIETEVQPLYGRVAIFEGLIPHAARPPSSSYRGPRYSFAVKMAANKWLSSRNMIHEEFHEKMDLLWYLASNHPDPAEMLKLSDDSGSFNARFARRYWRAFMLSREEERENLIEEALHETRGDGEKLNGLLNYLVAILKGQIAKLVEYGNGTL